MAELLKWDSKKYTVHVHNMDKEHQHLVHLMNRLYDLHGSKAPKSDQAKALSELYEYTQKHFSDEEKYFATVANYVNGETHKRIHQELLGKLKGFADAFSAPNGALTQDFFTFLKVWLTAHIGGIDMKYGDLVKKAG